MQFCTIDEAWGNRNHKLSEKQLSSESSEESPIKENFKNKKKKKVYFNHTEESLYEGLTDTINDQYERNKLVNKVLKSRRCRDILRKKFQPNLINKVNIILDDYRDIIVLVLIGFFIVIFLKTLNNINN